MTRLPGGISVLLLVAACGRDASSPPVADGQAGEPPSDELARGETLSLACQACHSLNPGAPHLIGPNLYGIFGRQAGSRPDYDGYSEALTAAGFVWTPELLERWLASPAGFLPGTTMAFTGYRSAEDRAALLRYLIAATGGDDAPALE